MARTTFAIIQEVRPGRMADFIDQISGLKKEMEAAPGSPRFTSQYVVAGGLPSPSGGQRCITTLEFADVAGFPAFQEALGPAELASILDRAMTADSPAQVTNTVLTRELDV